MNNKFVLDLEEYKSCARAAAAEGIVMLENRGKLLPLQGETEVAVFGRSQFNYYKSGTGSGGLVNTRYVVSILDALEANEQIHVNQFLENTYKEWLKDNPFDMGNGWAQEPWCQKEMPLTKELVLRAKENSDTAIIILGRTAGEDKDAKNEPGSYLLNELEEKMLSLVTEVFERTIVLLNVGSIIDMKWVKKYNPAAVLYVWQGGQEGGNAVLDVLTGQINPCGHLTDTIAENIEDYPSTKNFGGSKQVRYEEDVFVGYRYFSTFNRQAVLYPFGYGLSYTDFELSEQKIRFEKNTLKISLKIKNTGECPGKQVIQVYLKAPQSRLKKPKRSLIGFYKTKELKPDQEEVVRLSIPDELLASFDSNSFIMEAGHYKIYAGFDVRDASFIGEFEIDRTIVVKECLTTSAIDEKEFGYTGDFGYKLKDVYDSKISMGTFLSQLSDLDLRCLVRGEGMCSNKVTPGTAAAFGGVTDRLQAFGIPAGCCTDGPSGIRMDCGTYAFSLPNGTCLACTFNEKLNERLYEFEGRELRKNRIDILLGPGINIHRNPLNGRNFEYFSEDPLLTGKIAAAQLRGMAKYKVTGTIKHFACNNQEYNRRFSDAVVSERALREIYLRGFEIAVREGKAYSIMTSYGLINGKRTAQNPWLNTTILRDEWGFDGIVMTDWWANAGEDMASVIASGNDLYMVVKDAYEYEEKDNLKAAMEEGRLTRAQLEKCAGNILKVIMCSAVMDRYLNRLTDEERKAIEQLPEDDKDMYDIVYLPMEDKLCIDGSDICTDRGRTYLLGIDAKKPGRYEMTLSLSIEAEALAQVPITFFANGNIHGTQTLRDTGGELIEITNDVGLFINRYNCVKLFFGQGGIKIREIKLRIVEELTKNHWENKDEL